MRIVVPFVAESANKKLPARGPFKIELDFAIEAIQPDGSIDTSDPVGREVYHTLVRRGLGLKLVDYNGPGGGFPSVEVHGLKSVLSDYVENHYLKGSGFGPSDVQDFVNSIERA